MKALLFACGIGLALATPSFAQPGQAPADTSRPAASDMTGTNTNMGKGAAHNPKSAHSARRAGSTREQNAKEERETAQLNQQQLQQAEQTHQAR